MQRAASNPSLSDTYVPPSSFHPIHLTHFVTAEMDGGLAPVSKPLLLLQPSEAALKPGAVPQEEALSVPALVAEVLEVGRAPHKPPTGQLLPLAQIPQSIVRPLAMASGRTTSTSLAVATCAWRRSFSVTQTIPPNSTLASTLRNMMTSPSRQPAPASPSLSFLSLVLPWTLSS